MTQSLESLFLVLLATIIGLLAWALKKLISIDSSTAALQTWVISHEKLDDERFHGVTENLKRLWARFDRDSEKME